MPVDIGTKENENGGPVNVRDKGWVPLHHKYPNN